MDALALDIRYALRTLRRTPAFSVVVVLTLALGIGANTAIFSLLDQVVLRALPVEAPDRLVQLDGPGTFRGRTNLDRGFSRPMFLDLSQGTDQVFSALTARAPASVVFRVGDASERVIAEMVSGNTFDVLRARPALGRFFSAADDVVPDGSPLVVLSDGFWARRFNRAPGVVGQVVVVNTTPMTVVGVAAPGFTGVLANEEPAFFVPLVMKRAMTPTRDDLADRQTRWLNVVARLAPGVAVDQAKAAADVRYAQVNASELESVPQFAAASDLFKERFRAKKLVLHDASRGLSQIRADMSTPVMVLMGMVGLVLLIACANVANLMLARATGRQREMSVRLAIGAGRARLVRQTLVESAIVAALGGLFGLLVATWLGDVMLRLLPLQELGATLSTTPDLRVALFTFVTSALTAVIFGLAPALRGSALDLNRTLKEESSASGGGAQHARLRRALVVAQVALSMLLVAGAGLFARSLANLKQLGPGFDTEHVVTFAIDPALSGRSQVQIKQLYASLTNDLRALPGVTSAAFVDTALLTGSASQRTIQVQGYEPKPDENMNPWTFEAGPGYFATLSIPIVAGRDFTDLDADGAPLVGIVNETFARYYFGTENPIGRRVGFTAWNDAGRMEIVGVVKDTQYSQVRPGEESLDASRVRVPTDGVPRVVYTPFLQSEELGQMTGYVRASASAAPGVPSLIRETVSKADSALPVFAMTTLERTVDQSVLIERLLALLSASFGGLATALAAVGLYGVMSYSVARRTREIGIRVALGAARRDVLALVLGDVAVLIGAGILLGIPGAYAVGRAAQSRLFGLSPFDPWSVAAAAVGLATVGLVAGYLPARRAAAVAPITALRTE